MQRYADEFMGWLAEFGYTHCFFLAGGGSMHLLDAASKQFTCIPVVHEVSAVIATEYFNESNRDGNRAFALVTTGPGLTNAITGIAGAWLESRECLVVGGQVKRLDLKSESLRQKGIQEVDGISLVQSITKSTLRITEPIGKSKLSEVVRDSKVGRRGPVFIEVCIDASATPYVDELEEAEPSAKTKLESGVLSQSQKSIINKWITQSKRPILLLGAGVSQELMIEIESRLQKIGIPIASTWTGADRISSDYKYFAGRPNTYGMRFANVFQQQSDLMFAVGTRLNLQQTGFNYEEFMPLGKIVHVDIDPAELNKTNPQTDLSIQMDANTFLVSLLEILESNTEQLDYTEWCQFLDEVKKELPLIENIHESPAPYINPHQFINELSMRSSREDIIVACSSGGTFTATHQAFSIKRGQQLISNKGLASMGYGLAGAIGAAFSHPSKRILLLEGDGGFAQNLQELGTVGRHRLNIKMFITANEGYASIRTSQKSYFDNNYVGCDVKTGLGLPNWETLCSAYDIKYLLLTSENVFSDEFEVAMNSQDPIFFEVATDPNLLYFPKVSSKILDSGQMTSAAIHDMTPKISEAKAKRIFKHFPRELWGI